MNYVRIYDESRHLLDEYNVPQMMEKYLGESYIVEYYSIDNNKLEKVYSSNISYKERIDDKIYVFCDILWTSGRLNIKKDIIEKYKECLKEGRKIFICAYSEYGTLYEGRREIKRIKSVLGSQYEKNVINFTEVIMANKQILDEWCAKMAYIVKKNLGE